MPAALINNRLLHKCETCGNLNSPFGFNVDLISAMNSLTTGDKDNVKRKLGHWYCAVHKPREEI